MTDIPAIPPIPELLKIKAKQGKLVLFIGAGASRLVGYPSWAELASKYLNALWEHSRKAETPDRKILNYYEYQQLSKLEPRKLLSICYDLFEKNKHIIARPKLKDICQKSDIPGFAKRVYEYLRDFNAIYVTTNYDDCLAKAVPASLAGLKADKDKSVSCDVPQLTEIFVKEELLVSKLQQGHVLYLHGKAEEESEAIVTISDYLKHYQKDSYPAVLLEKLFAGNFSVLFVGYGLEEFEILEFIVSRSKTSPKEIFNFMLYPACQQEQQLLRFFDAYYEKLGIRIVPFSIDGAGHDQLEVVLREWSKEFKLISRPQLYLDQLSIIDEVA